MELLRSYDINFFNHKLLNLKKSSIKTNKLINLINIMEKQEIEPIKKVRRCKKEGCYVELDLANTFLCKYCNKKYCMGHRHDFSHNCVNIQKQQLDDQEMLKYKQQWENQKKYNQLVKKIMNEKNTKTKTNVTTKTPPEITQQS